MSVCGFPRPWSLLVHAWSLEHGLRAFDSNPSVGYSSKHRSTWPPHIKPTLTELQDGPTFHVATACSLAIVVSLVTLVAFLVLWRSQRSPPKLQPAVLSEATVLRIHDMASRQPYQMPPDGGGDPGTFAALPFSENPRKQSLFLFWLCFLLVAGAAAYFFSTFWVDAVSTYVTQKYSTLSWIVTLILSVVLANVSGQFLKFMFFLVPAIRSTIQCIHWIGVMMAVRPALAAHTSYLRVTQVAQYLSRWYFGIPVGLPLPERVGRSTVLVSGAVSAVGGYHLISSRVARNYTVLLKALFRGPLNLFDFYISLRTAQELPTTHFQIWAKCAVKHLLRFALGELTWRTVSRPKLFVLVGPTLIICTYIIYRYNQVVVPPRSQLQVALDPIYRKLYQQQILSQRQDIALGEINRILQNIDRQFTNANLGKEPIHPSRNESM
ncbi:hypothetical protein C8F04DRAFT_1072339 [Mycena alexandri]|uniref:Uncharacterized protein n=1 Tax=Mycena alexandri TaxID=1745969 RepID=A0AAD6TBT6_9AGAR|nr:hypothetical protein C8F04DRAFT_1072339 [Mycena alexandri]